MSAVEGNFLYILMYKEYGSIHASRVKDALRTRSKGVLGKIAEKDKGTRDGASERSLILSTSLELESNIGRKPTLCWGVLRMNTFVDVSEWKSKKTVKELNYLDNSHHHNKKSPLVRLKTVTQKSYFLRNIYVRVNKKSPWYVKLRILLCLCINLMYIDFGGARWMIIMTSEN